MQRQKKTTNDELYFFKTLYKRMAWMPSKPLKNIKKKTLKKPKSKNIVNTKTL